MYEYTTVCSTVVGHLDYLLIWAVKNNVSLNTSACLLVTCAHICLRHVFRDRIAAGFRVSSILVNNVFPKEIVPVYTLHHSE